MAPRSVLYWAEQQALYPATQENGLSATMSEADPSSIDAFIRRWAASGAAERANYQLFLSELCDVLEAPRPEPQAADDAQNGYVFEKAAK